jgi:dienelactone hydrolase
MIRAAFLSAKSMTYPRGRSGVFSVAALVALGAVTLTAQDPPNRKAEFALWRREIRKQLYVPDKLPPLEAKRWSSFSPAPGIIADRVTYRTSAGMLVPAIVYRPEHWVGQAKGVKLPGIVIVNGHGADKFTWYSFYSGMLFARAGAEVVTYDMIGEGERNADKKSQAGAHDRIVQTPEGVPADDWGQRLAGLMQVDLMQAVSYLAQRPEVDAHRIAVLGFSMGAFVSGIAGAIDPRIHAVLLSGGGTYDDEADGGKSFDVGKLPCQAPPWRSLRLLGDGPHMRGAVIYALNAERGPMLVENGSADEVMDIPHRGPEWFEGLREQAIALRGSDKNMFTTHVDANMGHRPAWVERTGFLWLSEQIHFANWSSAEISARPAVKVGEWAAANGVAIAKNYQRDDREGGLMGLGGDLPGIERDQLMVLPESEWERHKTELTYEGWAAKTMSAEKAGSR